MRIILLILIALAAAACTSTRYVPVESVRTEYKDRLQTRVDSVFVADSVFIREKGDTIYIEHTRYAYRDRYTRDTTYVSVVDTVCVPYPVPAELSRWQKFKQEVGGTAIVALVVLLGAGAVWLACKK